jgi:hypothetical protein
VILAAKPADRPALIEQTARHFRKSAKTVRHWVRRYECHGSMGLARKARADQGAERVCISREFDQLAARNGIGSAALGEIKKSLVRCVRSEWRSGAPDSSVEDVRAKVLSFAMNLAREHGITASDDELRHACTLPTAMIVKELKYRNPATAEKDAGRADATMRPRIRRRWSDVKPMEWAAGDVHPCDIPVYRDDGSIATARAISWLDIGTGRLKVIPLLCDKGTGVTRGDVIDSFAELCGDPAFGAPLNLYVDNGSEYGFKEGFDDLARGVASIRRHDGRAEMVNAQPYAPQSKVIEGKFRQVEKILEHMPGHIGSHRDNKKCSRKGKPVAPISYDAFCQQLETAVAVLNARPQPGSLHLKGQSPNMRFAQFVDDGWQSVTMTRDALTPYFSRKHKRKLKQGTFSFGSKSYYADALVFRDGESVIVHEPLSQIDKGRNYLLVYGADGGFIGAVEPEQIYSGNSREGAEEKARRDKVYAGKQRELKAETDTLDQVESWKNSAAVMPQASEVKPMNVVTFSKKAQEQRALQELKDKRPQRTAKDRAAAERESEEILRQLIPRVREPTDDVDHRKMQKEQEDADLVRKICQGPT